MNFLEYKTELEKINNNLVDILSIYDREQQDKILLEILKNKVILSKHSKLTILEAEQEVKFNFETIQSKL